MRSIQHQALQSCAAYCLGFAEEGMVFPDRLCGCSPSWLMSLVGWGIANLDSFVDPWRCAKMVWGPGVGPDTQANSMHSPLSRPASRVVMILEQVRPGDASPFRSEVHYQMQRDRACGLP